MGPLVIDIETTELTEEDRRRITHPLTGMVILFTRNYTDRKQLTALCREIHALKPGIVIAVDHEGGRVQRFREGFTEIPAMAALGRLHETDPLKAMQTASAVAYVLAAELRACGVDMTFAPCLDIDFQRSTIIGHRSLSGNPSAATLLALSLIEGMRQAGMSNCGKHFPGHGWVKADSHRELPVDDRALDSIRADDLVPYRYLSQVLDSVMAAHVLYSAVDTHAAGFSSFWLKTVLRRELGFTGAIFSDDLSMKGALSEGSILERAKAALQAGCDMLIVCNDFDATDSLLSGLTFCDSSERDDRVRGLLPKGEALSWTELNRSARYRCAKAMTESIRFEWQ